MSKWREQVRVHPAADAFPMMSDDELRELGDDIKAHGLKSPMLFWSDGKSSVLIDGRNRLEAMERAGLSMADILSETFICSTPLAHVISFNLRRRHLTKAEQADVIVKATLAAEEEEARQADEVRAKSADDIVKDLAAGVDTASGTIEETRRYRGGRGKVNKTKGGREDCQVEGHFKKHRRAGNAQGQGRHQWQG